MIVFRNLYPNELEKWFDFLVEEIFKSESKKFFSNHWYNDPYKDINGIFVAVDADGNFLSTLRVLVRDIYINGMKISCGGISCVGTKEEYRGQKLSTTLVQMSIKYMEDRNICISYLLSGDYNEKYYNRYGYYKCPRYIKYSSINKCNNDSYDYCIRDLNIEGDIRDISDIHEKFSSKFNGSIVRSMEYWKEWIVSNTTCSCKIAYDNSGKVIAYISFQVDNNNIEILDFGCLSEYINIFDSLIEKISSDMDGDNFKVIYDMNITSSMEVESSREPCCFMYKLITPFLIGNLKVDSSEKLLEILKGDGDVSKLLVWAVDDF